MPEGSKQISWPKETLKCLIDGSLDSDTIRQIQRGAKDSDRFENILEIEQARVPWQEKILIPLQEHLYVVQKGNERIVKCSCGYEYGDYRKNWKLNSLVYERPANDNKIYAGADPKNDMWTVLREFYCPGCGIQLDVENIAPGEPFIFNQIPDIDGFYNSR
jgi:acetone carboxylase gamma subunit